MTAESIDRLVDAVRRHGADTMFGVPGGGPNLALIGAAQAAGLRFVLTHGETAGAITAATYGRLTGAPAVALATRGPGAASATNGAAQATLDRYPLLLVTDCVATGDAERVAHQRLDQVAMLSPVTKWSGRIGGDAAAAETATAALHLAAAAPRGAVHLDVDPSAPSDPVVAVAAPAASDDEALERAAAALVGATHPVVIVGFEAVDEAASVRAAVERLGCPVLTTYQASGLLPEGHPQAAGLYTAGVIEHDLLGQADVIVTVGLDTVEPTPTRWDHAATTVVLTAVAPASTFLRADISLVGPLVATLDRLLDAAGASTQRWSPTAGAEALAIARSALAAGSATDPGRFGPLDLVAAVARTAPSTATVTVDAGAHFLAIMPFWPTRRPLQLLISNGLATMGFALPAAIGAALARPGEPVACLTGDGGLGMTLAELETVARLRLPVTVVVFDDAALSLIEIKQRPGQGGTDAVRFGPVDFAAVARAMGLEAVTADSVAEVEAALATGWDRPRLVDARIDPTAYTHLIRTTRG